MPNDKDRSWLDALSDSPLSVANYPGYAFKAAQFGGNALSNIGRSMSPVRFEDADGPSGQAGFVPQVPPMITETAGAWDRLFGEQDNWHDGPGEVYPGDMNADAATAALAFYGGNALNPLAMKPRGAIASGVAKEAPQPIRAYRGDPTQVGRPESSPYYWSTSSPKTASDFAMMGYGDNMEHLLDPLNASLTPTVTPVDMTFKSPLVIDSQTPYNWSNVPFEGVGTSADSAARYAAGRGHDGLILKNIIEGVGGAPATDYVALQPGTVKSATTGETLFSDNTPSIKGMAAGTADQPRGRHYDLIPDAADLKLDSRAPFAAREGTTRHAYDISTRAGDEAGRIEIALNTALGEGYIDNMTLLGNEHGAAGMRDVIRSLKMAHPEIKKLYGERTSGAKAGTDNTTQSVNLFSDNKPSIMGMALGTADQPQGIRAYRGVTMDRPPSFMAPKALYSSSDPATAGTYANHHPDYSPLSFENGAMLPVDLHFQNPMTVDAQGSNWASIPDGEGQFPISTDSLAERARQRGHDGLIVRNVQDSKFARGHAPADTYVALKRGTVKSPLTGETLFSDNKPSILGGSTAPQYDPELEEILRRYEQ